MPKPKIIIPRQSTAKDYWVYLDRHVHDAVASWRTFADSATLAYAQAYKQQGQILQGVKQQLEADRKKDDAILSFTLSLITVAAAGPIAGCLSGKLAGGLEKEAADKFAKWATEKGAKAATDAAVKYLHPETLKPDPFEAAGVSPIDYMATMLERIDTRDRNLTHQIIAWADMNLTPDEARAKAETVVNSSFVKETPPDHIDKNKLGQSAALGLWIGWAYARDRAYWRWSSIPMNRAYGEAFEFKPLLGELRSLGVPVNELTLKGMSNAGFLETVNMDAFIKWATGPHAIALMFSYLPPHADGFALARSQMTLRMASRVAFGI